MAVEGSLIYKSAADIVAEVLAALQARIPDVEIGPDAIFRIWTEVFANSAEGLYLAAQLTHDDMFIQTMSALALQRAGEMYGRPEKAGTFATGSVRFSGAGGTFIGSGALVAALRPALEDALMFATDDDATIPNPGIPDFPIATDHAAGVLPAGTYEYAVSFLTTEGETEISGSSDAIVIAINREIEVTGISLGGPGTTGRRIYRRVNGANWLLNNEIDDNVTDNYIDNTAADGVGVPVDTSNAERVTVDVTAQDTGAEYNVAVGTITSLQDVPAGIADVINIAALTGGTDEEDIEAFRTALLNHVRAPGSGSAQDLINAVTAIEGVDSASVFPNVDLSDTATPGTVSIRIAGPAGAIPDGGTVDAALAAAEALDLANITILVGTFDAVAVDVDVTVTPSTGYVLADVSQSVVNAITTFINSLPVGQIVFVAGIVSAAFGLQGVDTIVVTAPAADVAMTDTQKAVAGVITPS